MSIGSRIKEARIHKKMTQQAIADRIGITAGAIGNYENGTSSPREEILIALMDVLEVDANYIFQDMMPEEAKERMRQKIWSLRSWGEPILDAYESKDLSTQKSACNVLEIPHIKIPGKKKTPKQKEVNNIVQFPIPKAKSEVEMVSVKVSNECTAAGDPAYLLYDGFETVDFPADAVPYKTEYGIHVNGDSMEPTIPNGAVVFVRRVFDLPDGEIGVFIVDGNGSVCKRPYRMKKHLELRSDNPEYKPIKINPGDDGFRFGGKVLGWWSEDK